MTSFFVNKCLEYFLQEDAGIAGNCKDKQQPDLFPPWALHPKAFKKSCTGCGECAAACEDNLIIFKENELPVMDFSLGPCS
ncbi:MAG: hydrogenase, partial [Candidatus Electrothrix sp. AR1]|nr:hydrogenase [Candidatus Electrothrix sp. AR1]